jgi:membrane protein
MDLSDRPPPRDEPVPSPTDSEYEATARVRVEAVLTHLPSGLQRRVSWLLDRWLGRVGLQWTAGLIRIEVFDRAMTIAAQFFTSVLPILILLAAWEASSDRFADAIELPEQSRSVIEGAVQGGDAAFGILGTLFVLVSATSLSRALTRAFAAIWFLPRPRTRLKFAWRWLSVVLVLALSLVVVRTVSKPLAGLPPRELWPLAFSLACDVVVATFVPWALLAGAVRARLLVPGALLFATLMAPLRPATSLWLPRALEASADRYGSIGVAFTYLTWLYVASFCFLATAVLGQVIASDQGRIGARIRGLGGEGPGQGEVPSVPSRRRSWRRHARTPRQP